MFLDEAHFDLDGYVKSTIVALGDHKTHTHALKSRRTVHESLFGADFRPEA